MKLNNLILISILLIIITGVIAGATSLTRAEKARFLLKERVIRATKEVARQSGDKEAIKLANFMKKSFVLVEPKSVNGKRALNVLEANHSEKWFYLVLLEKKDLRLKGWDTFVKGFNAFGTYQYETNSIIIRFDQKMSDRWVGIYLLHETKHAYDYLSHPYREEKPEEYLYREIETYEFQNRIQAKIFGKLYLQYVKNQSANMVKKLKKAKIFGKGWYGPEVSNGLPDFLGKSQSDFEKRAIYTAVWVAIVFHVIDNNFKKAERQGQKAGFLASLYRQNLN